MYFGPLPRPLSNTLPSRALLPPGPPVWSEWLPSTWIWSLWLLPWSRPTEYFGPYQQAIAQLPLDLETVAGVQ